MSTAVAAVVPSDSERRWLAWQARGAANDRVTASRIKLLALVVAIGFAVLVLSRIL
jgi:hypothetical protein